nr:MAG TPA: hypothetical protein [Caudoviricetes sp.]
MNSSVAFFFYPLDKSTFSRYTNKQISEVAD